MIAAAPENCRLFTETETANFGMPQYVNGKSYSQDRRIQGGSLKLAATVADIASQDHDDIMVSKANFSRRAKRPKI